MFNGSQTLSQDSLLDFLGSAPDPPEERSARGLSLRGYLKFTKVCPQRRSWDVRALSSGFRIKVFPDKRSIFWWVQACAGQKTITICLGKRMRTVRLPGSYQVVFGTFASRLVHDMHCSMTCRSCESLSIRSCWNMMSW